MTDYLVEKVWGHGYEGNEKLIRQAIHRLRKKIEQDPHNPGLYSNSTGAGIYVFSTR